MHMGTQLDIISWALHVPLYNIIPNESSVRMILNFFPKRIYEAFKFLTIFSFYGVFLIFI